MRRRVSVGVWGLMLKVDLKYPLTYVRGFDLRGLGLDLSIKGNIRWEMLK